MVKPISVQNQQPRASTNSSDLVRPSAARWAHGPLQIGLFAALAMGGLACEKLGGAKAEEAKDATTGADAATGSDASVASDAGNDTTAADVVGGDTAVGDTAVGDTVAPLPPVPVAPTAGMVVNVLDKAFKASVKIRVTDDLGAAIAGAEVVVAGKAVAVTGDLATLTDLVLNSGIHVNVRAPGYASSSFLLDPVRALQGFNIVLRKYEATKTFPAVLGGTLEVGTASVTLEADGVVGPGGAAYSGKVKVSAAAIDIGRDLLDALGGISSVAAARVPEPIVSIKTKAGTASAGVKLASATVELTGDAGQALQPAAGKPATVVYKLGSALAGAFPAAFQAGAKLDVASRDEASGAWSVSAQCTVAGTPGNWTCKAALPHFSESAVVAPTKKGCLVVGEIALAVPKDKAVTWRSNTIVTPDGYQVPGYFYDNGGKLGLCAVMPVTLESLAVRLQYELGAAGAQAQATPTFAAGTTMVQSHYFLSTPVEQGVDQAAAAEVDSAESCQKVCGAVPKQVAAFSYTTPPEGPAGKPIELKPPPAPLKLPVDDFSKVDLDKDGSMGDIDCDDMDPKRAPGKADVCGDGIDQDCSGADLKCAITCMQAFEACFKVCVPAGAEAPETPKEVACVGACEAGAPLTTAEEDKAWKGLSGCVSACKDKQCISANCGGFADACFGKTDPPDPVKATCATAAPCVIGCLPLQAGGNQEAYAVFTACVQACPGTDEPQQSLANALIACGAEGACPAKLGTCGATMSKPKSACTKADLSCYANLPSCAAAYAACFKP